MVYYMEFYVDGGCRSNGQPGAFGAAAAVQQMKWGKHKAWTRRLFTSDYYKPTNQRAEITAIVVALECALENYDGLHSNPYLDLTIYSDSQYAVKIVNEWIYKWTNNGWINSKGKEVANRDLIQEASELDDRVKELGEVTYKFIPRSENQLADQYCNDAMDEMENERSDEYSSDDDDYYW